MDYVFTDPRSGREWMIKPLDNGLCYQVFKANLVPVGQKAKNKKTVKSKWLFTGSYPYTFESAINTMLEKMLADPDVEGEIKFKVTDLKALSKELKDFTSKVAKSMKGIKDGKES